MLPRGLGSPAAPCPAEAARREPGRGAGPPCPAHTGFGCPGPRHASHRAAALTTWPAAGGAGPRPDPAAAERKIAPGSAASRWPRRAGAGASGPGDRGSRSRARRSGGAPWGCSATHRPSPALPGWVHGPAGRDSGAVRAPGRCCSGRRACTSTPGRGLPAPETRGCAGPSRTVPRRADSSRRRERGAAPRWAGLCCARGAGAGNAALPARGPRAG